MTKPTRRKLLRSGVVAGGLLLPAAGTTASAELADDAAAGLIVLGAPRFGTLYTIHGDGSDTTELWQEALLGIARAGGGAIRASGEHIIGRELTLPDVTALEIAGEGAALLRKGRAGQEFRIFSGENLRATLPTLAVRNIRFIGDWDYVQSAGGNAARCIAVRGYHRVTFQDLAAEAFRNMTFSADDCDEVRVQGCRVLRSARDPINLTGSRFVKVVDCTIQNAWDDAIAVHVPHDSQDETRRYAAIISNNQILQTNGIKVLGGRDITICGNQIIAPNNYGIYLGHDPYWREGGVPHRDVVIADNIVSEMIAHDYLHGQGDVGAGIFFADPGRRVLSTRIQGNIVTKYKPSGAGIRYSAWGLGPSVSERRLFTADGWTDPELIHGHQGKGIGIRVISANAEDRMEIAIEANSFANLATDIDRRVEE